MLMPEVIKKTASVGIPPSYEWDITVSRAMLYLMDGEHASLVEAFWRMNPRAGLAAVMATAEWVAWRFHGWVDATDLLQRIEAGYAAVVDWRYADVAQPQEPFPSDDQHMHGPLKLARMLVAYALDYAKRGEPVVLSNGVSMALLARHVSPDAMAFDKWLSVTLRRCSLMHSAAKGDATTWSFVPRAWFYADQAVQGVSAEDQMGAFLAALKPAENPYLRTPESMRALGFVGEPYVLA